MGILDIFKLFRRKNKETNLEKCDISYTDKTVIKDEDGNDNLILDIKNEEPVISINEFILVDNEMIKVVYRDMILEDNEVVVNLLIENRIDRDIMVQSNMTSVNGVMNEAIFSCKVARGMKAYDEMTFEFFGESINCIEGLLNIIDRDSYEDLAYYGFKIINQEYKNEDINEDVGEVIVNNSFIEIKSLGKYYTDDNQWALEVLIENKLDRYITVQTENVSVNGMMTYILFSCNIAPLKKARETMLFDEEILELINVEGTFKMMEYETYEDIVQSKFKALEGEPQNQDIEEDTTREVLINNESIRISKISVETNEDKEMELKVIIENKVDEDVVVQMRNVSVNGLMMDPIFSCRVASDKKAIDVITFDKKIKELVNVEGVLSISNSDTFDEIAEIDFSMLEGIAKKNNGYGKIILNNDIIKVKYSGITYTEDKESIVKLFIENKSNKDISITLDMVSVNGVMADPYFSCYINSGKRIYEVIKFDEYFAKDSFIKGTFEVNDSNEWEEMGCYPLQIN